MLVKHAGRAGCCTRKDELKENRDKAGGKSCGNDAADDVVDGGGILVLGAVDLEGSHFGAVGAFGVL